MSKQATFSRRLRTGQPYTRVSPEKTYTETTTSDGQPGLIIEDGYRIIGYTLEEQLVPEKDKGEDPTYEYRWQEIDLGHKPTLEEAHQVAADWRESLRGVYEIR